MQQSELDAALRKVMEEGFNESFRSFCAKTFSSYSYPEKNLAAARMHAYFLRIALDSLCDNKAKAEVLSMENSGEIGSVDFELLCLFLARDCYRAALHDEGDFCELFIQRWCRVLSI